MEHARVAVITYLIQCLLIEGVSLLCLQCCFLSGFIILVPKAETKQPLGINATPIMQQEETVTGKKCIRWEELNFFPECVSEEICPESFWL